MKDMIEHKIGDRTIIQNPDDWFINASAMTASEGKEINDYLKQSVTKDFLKALIRETGIKKDRLWKLIDGDLWVNPMVAIHLGQWCSPKFAVAVTELVLSWMKAGNGASCLPYHLQQSNLYRSKIPGTHFSILQKINERLLADIETVTGLILPFEMQPYLELKAVFDVWLVENGHDSSTYPTYEHEFKDIRYKPITAILYPGELQAQFLILLNDWIGAGEALKYFSQFGNDITKAIESVYVNNVNSIE